MSRPRTARALLGLSAIAALFALSAVPFSVSAAPVLADKTALSFDTTGAKVGQQLPNLTVYTLDGKPVPFAKAWNGVLVTASLTCPKSRETYPTALDLATALKPQGVRVSILYVIEAHPDGDLSPYKGIIDVTPANRRDNILFRQPTTLDDRLKLARAFRDRMNVPAHIEMYVDAMSNDAWRHVGGGPNMGLVIDAHGIVQARQGWFEAGALKTAADERASVEKVYANAEARLHPPGLHVASRGGSLERVNALLAVGEDPNKPAMNGPTALQEALLYNRGEVAKRLLAAGARTNAFSSAALGEVSVVKRLLDTDATVGRRRDGWGRDLLDYAAASGRIEMAKLLISYGVVDDRAPSSDETLALHWAARNGRSAMAALLLDQAGADAGAKDRDGRTPLDYAEEAAAKANDAASSAAATRDLLKQAAGKPVKPTAMKTQASTSPPPASVVP